MRLLSRLTTANFSATMLARFLFVLYLGTLPFHDRSLRNVLRIAHLLRRLPVLFRSNPVLTLWFRVIHRPTRNYSRFTFLLTHHRRTTTMRFSTLPTLFNYPTNFIRVPLTTFTLVTRTTLFHRLVTMLTGEVIFVGDLRVHRRQPRNHRIPIVFNRNYVNPTNANPGNFRPQQGNFKRSIPPMDQRSLPH